MPPPADPLFLVAGSLQLCLLGGGATLLALLRWHQPWQRWWQALPGMPEWDRPTIEFLALAWLVVTGAFFGQLAASWAFAHLPPEIRDEPAARIVLGGAGFHVGALLGWIAAHHWARHRGSSLPLVDAPPPDDDDDAGQLASARWWHGAALFCAVVPVVWGTAAAWTFLLRLLGIEAERQELVGIFAQVEDTRLLVAMVLLAVVVAPVTEELVFRAGLYRFLLARTQPAVAALVSAIFFALLHFNLLSFMPLVALGAVFALVYRRMGRIVVPMLAHALFNLNTIALVLALPGLA
jgi:hypothetical protein